MNKKFVFISSTVILLILRLFSLLTAYVNMPDTILIYGYLAVCISLFPKAFYNKTTISFAVFLLFMFLKVIVLKSDVAWYFRKYTGIVNLLTIFNVLVYLNNRSFYKIIGITLLSIISINIITTLPWLMINASALREVAGGVKQSSSYPGMLDYYQLHSLPFLLPLFIYRVKTSINIQDLLFWSVLLLLTFLILIKASFGTILLLSMVAIFVSFILRKNTNFNTLLILFAILITPILIDKDTILYFLDKSKPIFIDTAIEEKIDDIESSIIYGKEDGQVAYRGERYKLSWNSFLESPIIGTKGNKLVSGGHSFFLDLLAVFGLIGSIPFFLFIYYLFKITIKLSPIPKPYILLSFFLYLLLAFLKGASSFSNLLFVTVAFMVLGKLSINQKIKGPINFKNGIQ